jgi:F0F1-type ATP synthase assembly protein I
MPTSEKTPIKKPADRLNDYAKYSSMAFQMIAVVLVCIWGGIQLDKLHAFKFPLFTVVLSIFSVFISLYLVLKDLLKKK